MTVAFNAVGNASSTGDTAGSSPNNISWSHTASGSDRAVLVFVMVNTNGSASTASITRSATYGGVAMTDLGAGPCTTGTGNSAGHMLVFGLLNPATGAQTVAVSHSAAGTMGGAGNSISYTGVDSFGTVTTASGIAAGTAMSLPVTGSASGRMISAALGALMTTNGNNIGSFNQTQRFAINRQNWSPAIVAGDAAGSASTVTFTGTRTSGVGWRSYAVDLIEAVAGNTGAFFALF